MDKEFQNFKEFFFKNKMLILSSSILAFIIYIVKITTPAIGMDTNQYLFDMNVYNKHWLSIGRVGQVLLKKIIWHNNYNFILWNILGIILFVFSVILFVYILQKVSNEKINDYVVLSCLIITSPLFVFQFYFVLQIFEFSLCLILVLISVYINEFTHWDFILKAIIISLFLGLSFGVYNTFILFYTLTVAAVQLVKISNAVREKKEYNLSMVIKEYFVYAIFGILGILAYLLLNKIALWHYGVEQVSHASNLIYWFTLPFGEAFKKFIHSIFNFFFLPGASSGLFYYNYADTLCLILVVFGMINIFMKNKKLIIHTILAVSLLFISGLGVVVATTSFDLARTMVPQLPFMIAVGIFWGFSYVNSKYIKSILVLLLAFLTFVQVKDSSDLVVAEKMTFQEDYTKMVEIDMSIKNLQLDDLQSKKVVITGSMPASNKFTKGYSYELIGISMLQFGFSDDPNIHAYYSCENTLFIMSLYGMRYQKPSPEEYREALQRHPEILTSTKSLSTFSDDKYIYVHIR